jgi:hypothetical protein
VVVLSAALAAVALASSTDFIEPRTSPAVAGDEPVSVATADLDDDGDADLAVANHGSDDVTILKNSGRGKFFQRANSPEAAGSGPEAVAAADLDGDGDADLAVANQDSNDVTILKNHGHARFAEPATSPVAAGSHPFSVAAADLDADADADLAVADFGSDEVTILENNGHGEFTEAASIPEVLSAGPEALTAVDLDGDGDRDLAVANDLSNDVTILKNDGAADFTQPASSPEAVGEFPRALAAADLDGDGDADLAVANYFGAVTILRNNGAANFNEPETSPEPVGFGPDAVAAADFDGDNKPDLAVANNNSNDVTILRNDGRDDFTAPETSPERAGSHPGSVAAADLDGDGDADLAVANIGLDDVTILKNR